MKKRVLIILELAMLILILINLTGCSKKTTMENQKSKIEEELNYLDSKIVSILNQLNNISLQNYTITSEEINLGQEGGSSSETTSGGGTSTQGSESEGQQKQTSSQSKLSTEEEKSNITVTQMEVKTILETNENEIDWKLIKNEIETINEAWGVIILDLSNSNVNSNDILEFSNTLNDCIISIKDENKIEALKNGAKLYSVIPKFEKEINGENTTTENIKKVKSYVINAYSLAEEENWTEIEKNIFEAEQNYKNITNDIEYIKNKEYKVNKTYVLLKELQNSLQNKDKKIFYINYKNLLENINTL